MNSKPTQDSNRWPSQVKYILGNEAAERFSYYGMKGILALYITNVLLQTKDQATSIIHLFGFVNYFMPLIGAWVSDRFWGRYHTILWISLSYCVGHGVMALSDFIPTTEGKVLCLYAGLGLIAFGAGGIKPCVSAFMGDQFRADQRHLLQKAYAAFYWSINLGSTASFLIIPWIRKEWGYSWAFGVPGLAMAFATLVFWSGTKHYVRVPPASKTKSAGFFTVLLCALTNRGQRQFGQSFWDTARGRHSAAEVDAAKSVGPILSIFLLVPIFWALFDQTFSTWVLQGEQMKSCFIATDARFTPGDVKDVNAVAARLLEPTNVAAHQVWGRLSAPTRELIQNTNAPAATRSAALVTDLNALVTAGASLYDSNRFAAVKLPYDARFLLSVAGDPAGPALADLAAQATTGGGDLARLNRLLLESVFPGELSQLYRIGPEEMLSANPILVMIFVPIMTLLVYPVLRRFASPLRRMSYGMFLAAASFVIVAVLQQRLDAGQALSILWQSVPYLVLTMAEVLLSTTGLEFAFREAAPSMKSTIMGFWCLTVALGNLFVTVITALAGKILGKGDGSHDVSVTPTMFLFYAALTFVVAIFFSIIAAFYKYRDASAAQGQ